MATAKLLSARHETGRKRTLLVVAPFFLALGALGFFGTALSSMGGLNWLPQSFEWPIGAASGVVQTSDHLFVVPHTPSGRVQVYDTQWKFVRGWHIDAAGGTFRLFMSEPNRINVITSRGHWHYIYSLDGALLSTEHYAHGSYDSFPNQAMSRVVPTHPWLWIFTSPFYSWAAAAVGVVLLIFANKTTLKTATSPEGS